MTGGAANLESKKATIYTAGGGGANLESKIAKIYDDFCVFWPTFVILCSIQWKVEEEIPSKYHGLSVNGLRKHDQKEGLSRYVQVFLRIPLAWKEKYNKHATVYMFSYHVDGPAFLWTS
jgi:hypothetical protein